MTGTALACWQGGLGSTTSGDRIVHAAASFIATHGRVLDRRRLQLLLGEADSDEVLAALDAYRNPDGGCDWGLEPDLRSTESQPAAAMHALEVLAAVAERVPEAHVLLGRLGRYLPADGSMHVEGGAEDEMLHPLDFAPHPDRPVRELFSANVITADLERLARLQQSDGGWPVGFASCSLAAALEWRGYATVHAVDILRSNAH